jgi:hypothetical protein
MKLSEAFPSKFLKAVDVPKPTVATIKLAEAENIKGLDGKEQRKCVLYFAKKLKPLPLNRVNFESIMDIGSDDSNDFPGTKIELFTMKVQGPNGITDGVRIRVHRAWWKRQSRRRVRRRTTTRSHLSTTRSAFNKKWGRWSVPVLPAPFY